MIILHLEKTKNVELLTNFYITMKKFTFFFLFFAIHAIFISGLFAQQMTYSNLRDGNGISIGLALDSYELTSLNYRGEAMHEISLSGIFIPNDEGMPNLPRISRFVAVPKGAEIRVSVKKINTETLQNINIAPALRIQAIPEEPVTDYVKNTQVYEKNEFYPQNIYEVSEVANLRGVNTVMLGITPFQFNPVTKELIVITNIELEIEYIGGSREYEDVKYRSPWFDPILKNALLNYEVLEDIVYTPKTSRSGTGCEYLIVIPNRTDFEQYAQQIKEFRTKQGIYTKIMRLDEMGVTTNTQLKTFFHNAYNTWDIPPVAVLLMADHNTNMALGIPAETISHPYSGTCITDNQYASLGSNLLPNMVFGRMAAETPAQMAVLVSKFIEYETQPCTNPSYYQNPITALGWQTERWFQICSEAVGGYWRQHEKTPVRINAIYDGTPGTSWSSATNTAMVTNYFGPSGTGYIPATPSELGGWSGGTAAQVVTAVNNGAFALQHRDHGFENGWGEPDFTSTNINSLTNVGKMTYLFTINCLTGKFNHSSPCFGEVFHRYTYQGQNAGCVGFLGPTEVSYSFVNDTYVWGMYDLFDPTFLPTYGPQGPHSAAYSGNWMPAFGNVAGKYFLAQSNWPYNTDSKVITYQMFTPHSDVFLRLFTEVPQTNNVSHADVTLAGNSDFLISAAAGSLISLTTMVDGNIEILDVAVATGGTQVMKIPSTLIPTTIINVVVTGQNYLRYESEVMVVPAEGPYIVPIGYETVGVGELTYISENREISVLLKNVGIETTDELNITISSDDPQLTITQNTAQCAGIAPDETKTANFKVTVAHDIPNNKIFSVNVTVTDNGKSKTWESKMSLKAFAPVFSLKKVLIDDVENGNLPKGSLVKVTCVVENKGGADAYKVIGSLNFESEYITLACVDTKTRGGNNLPVGETIAFDFNIITDPNMPSGYEATIDFALSAMYERSYTAQFKAVNTSASNYCTPGSSNCSYSSPDKFTLVKLYKTATPTVILIDHNPTCGTSGYTDYTNINVPLEPGQYKLDVSVGTGGQQYIKGWFDLNGDNIFGANELLVDGSCTSGGSTSFTFIIPQDFTPGEARFRLRCKYSSTMNNACEGYSYGQTLDYTIVLPELYPRVKNVEAVLDKTTETITITWEEPVATPLPIGYNIYRNGKKLNEELLIDLSFTETDLGEGVYAYNVKAFYTGNKESYAEMSNVICYYYVCNAPESLEGKVEGKTAILKWLDPVEISGTFKGYYIYRNDVKINEEPILDTEYVDENLPVGTYTYQVSAVSSVCDETEKTDSVSITIVPEFCEPPIDIEGGKEEGINNVIITWKEPANIDRELVKYVIIRNGEEIGETLPNVLIYVDEDVEVSEYTYKLMAVYEDCESDYSEEIQIIILGINEIQENAFHIFPNPTNGDFVIQSSKFKVQSVEIYDVMGRKIPLQFIEGVDGAAGRGSKEEWTAKPDGVVIGLTAFPSGIYFVKIYAENHITVTKQLVIMK